jgi:hypothetical protein
MQIAFMFPIFFYFWTFKEKVSKRERWFCYFVLTYGTIGGCIASAFALRAMFTGGVK